MKTISTLFLAMLFVVSSTLLYGQNDNAREGFTVFSSNDSNAVIVTSFYYDHLPWATNLNIAEGTSETFQLEIMNSSDLMDIQMNSISRLTYYFTNNKVIIYEFGATKSTRFITLDDGGDNFGVSSDGSKIYSYSNSQEYVSIFDAMTGERLDRFFVNSFKGAQPVAFFNSAKDEFYLQNGTSLYVWSIANKVQDREITILNPSANFKFIDDGNTLAYTTGGEVVIAKSSDGEVTYRKDFGYKGVDNIEFSANMNYLVVNNSHAFSVFDMVNKKIVKDNNAPDNNDKNIPTYMYVNNDNSRAVAMDIIDIYCGRNFEDAVTDYIYSIYKTENLEKLASAPYGYIPRPENAIVSKDNKLLVVSGSDIGATITNALVDNQENFIKYVNVDAYPVTFLEDNNRIAFVEEGKFKVYNTESEEFEREFETGIENYNEVYFFSNGDGRIVITDDSEIKVYDYTTFELVYTFNYSELGLEPTDISFDNNSTISVYSLKRLHKFNAYTGEKSDTPITNMDPTNKLVDVSINGRFLLFRTTDNEFIVYDNTLKSEVYKEKPSFVDNGMVYLSAGFFGNQEIMWVRYESNPVDRLLLVSKYDFVTKKIEKMSGDREPIISNDGSLFYSHYCPVEYEIGAIRDPQTSVESTTSTITGGIYPNPASDFIKLDLNTKSINSEIQIFDAYGKQVMSIIYIGENIDISGLTAGVYFVKVGDKSWKFIKL
ncbi:MAG: T9SS type A sorting domain-containing protein [Candidatus Kapaibacterium sp.]